MSWQRNLWVLSISVFLANISFSMFLPFFPNMLIESGLAENVPFWTGMLVSSGFLTAGLMAPVWGSLADRYGKRIMLARSGYGLAAAAVLMAFAVSPWQLLVTRIINGLLSGFIPAAVMLTVSNTPQEKMGLALGTLNSSTAIGSIMGPFVGGILVHYIGVRNNVLASVALLLIATTLAVAGTREKVHEQKERTTILQDLQLVAKSKALQIFFISMVVLNMTGFMFTAVLPIRVGEISAANPDVNTGVIFSLTGITLSLGSMLIGKITRFSYLHILLTGLSLSGALCVLQGFTSSLFMLGFSRLCYGLTVAAVNVSANVLITLHSKEESRGRVFGILNSFTSFGAVIGPLAGGALAEVWGTPSAFYFSAVVFFAAVYITWYFTVYRPDKISVAENGGAS